MKAIILAAGRGSRLEQHTEYKTKCMVEVGGVSLIERLIRQLYANSMRSEDIYIAVGYQAETLEAFLNEKFPGNNFKFVYVREWNTTNNSWTLYKTLSSVLNGIHSLDDEMIALFESDIILSDAVVSRLCATPHSFTALLNDSDDVSLDGGYVNKLNDKQLINQFVKKSNMHLYQPTSYWKTINCYVFSSSAANYIIQSLKYGMNVLGYGAYYEECFNFIPNTLVPKHALHILKHEKWGEIDTEEDLNEMTTKFNQ